MQVEKGYYKIINRLNAMALDGKEEGSVKQSTDNSSSGDNQQWRFIPTDPVSVDYSSRDQLPAKGRVTGINADDIIYDLNGKVIKRNGIGLSEKSTISRGVYLVKKVDSRKVEIRCFSY